MLDQADNDWYNERDKTMKQYTSKEQTAKLIELGFEKPCSIASVEPIYGMGGISVAKDYSIGELIEMLPRDRGGCPLIIDGNLISEKWAVYYEGAKGFSRDELIDALYEMAIKLKEEGVIRQNIPMFGELERIREYGKFVG